MGILLFGYISDFLLLIITKYWKMWKARYPGKPSKKFTWRNKMIVKVKRKYGLLGLAVLTPSVLSMPLGMLLAERYFHNKQRVILFMITSVIFWSIAISSYKLFF
jgi:hypothetical protein